MPGGGQPFKRACYAALDAREEEIFDRLRGGNYVTRIAADVLADTYEEAGKDEPSTYYFYAWLDAEEGRRERFDRARRSAADAMAEDSVRLLDDAREEGVRSTAEATLARAQSSSRQWFAGKLNRERYGEGKQAGVEVNLSLGELHLEALKEHGHMGPDPEKERQLQEADRRAVKGEESGRVVEADYEIEGEAEPQGSGPGEEEEDGDSS